MDCPREVFPVPGGPTNLSNEWKCMEGEYCGVMQSEERKGRGEDGERTEEWAP